jgi:hypothetical protein
MFRKIMIALGLSAMLAGGGALSIVGDAHTVHHSIVGDTQVAMSYGVRPWMSYG